MTPLTDAEVERALAGCVGWLRQGDAIVKSWERASFTGAIRFVSRVAELAEAHDHHPDILVQYRRVTLTLSTHDAGGISERDFRLARAIDASEETT